MSKSTIHPIHALSMILALVCLVGLWMQHGQIKALSKRVAVAENKLHQPNPASISPSPRRVERLQAATAPKEPKSPRRIKPANDEAASERKLLRTERILDRRHAMMNKKRDAQVAKATELFGLSDIEAQELDTRLADYTDKRFERFRALKEDDNADVDALSEEAMNNREQLASDLEQILGADDAQVLLSWIHN